MVKMPILYVYAFSMIVFLMYAAREIIRDKKSLGLFWEQHYVPLVMLMAAAAWFGLFVHSQVDVPRYRLLGYPFIVFGFYYACQIIIQKQGFRVAALIMMICSALIGAYGIFYKPVPASIHAWLERSLEYRDDLKVQMAVAHEVETNYGDFMVAAPFTVAQALAFPELGFVSKRLDVMIYEFRVTYGGIKNFEGLSTVDVAKTVWVGFKPKFDELTLRTVEHYPYGPLDRILKTIVHGEREATLFMGGTYIQRMLLLQSKAVRSALGIK